MFKVILCSFLMMAGFAFGHEDGHSGPLDHRSAHNCWVNCEHKGLSHGEYHEH